jgi:hypothetical protein
MRVIHDWPTWPDDRPYEFEHRSSVSVHQATVALCCDLDHWHGWPWVGHFGQDWRLGWLCLTLMVSWGRP